MKFTLFCLLLLNLALSTTMAASSSSVFAEWLEVFFNQNLEQIANNGDMELRTVSSGKLKESLVYSKTDAAGSVNLEDYNPIDPVPSSKASIKHGPIEHGSPLNPFIPKPPPPAHPKR